MGIRLVISALLVSSVMLSGCAVLSYGTFSSVDGSDQAVVGRKSRSWNGFRGTDTVEFEHFRLRIAPHNDHTSLKLVGLFLPLVPLSGGSNPSELISEHEHRDAFLVTLSVESKSPRLAFDPTRVILLIENDRAIRPIGYWGCTDYWDYLENKMKRPPTPVNSSDQSQAEMPSGCVTLLYDVRAPSPSKQFRLSVEGARVGETALSLKPVTFLPSSEWDYSFAQPQ